MFTKKKKETQKEDSKNTEESKKDSKKQSKKLPFYTELEYPFQLEDGTPVKRLVCEKRPTLKMVKELMAAEEYEYIDCMFHNLLEAVVDEGTIPLTQKLVNKIDMEDGMRIIGEIKSFFPSLAES